MKVTDEMVERFLRSYRTHMTEPGITVEEITHAALDAALAAYCEPPVYAQRETFCEAYDHRITGGRCANVGRVACGRVLCDNHHQDLCEHGSVRLYYRNGAVTLEREK